MNFTFSSCDIIHSLSVPTRRAILDVLRGRELASSDIASHFELSAPASAA
ncbi:ArsR family transcriptional regulator [Fictibacillus sp. KU28468]